MPNKLPRGRRKELLRKYDFDYQPVPKPISLYVDWEDIKDVLHILRSRKHCYVKEMIMLKGEYRPVYFTLDKESRFRLTSDIDSDNHPHVDEFIPKGNESNFHEGPYYGTVDFDRGIPLGFGDKFYEINFEFLRLLKG